MYPGARLVTAMVSRAWHTNRLPSEVYAEMLTHPQDYKLLFAYGAWEAAQREKAAKARH